MPLGDSVPYHPPGTTYGSFSMHTPPWGLDRFLSGEEYGGDTRGDHRPDFDPRHTDGVIRGGVRREEQ